MAEPGTFWKRLVISFTERITNFCASWNSILSIELLKKDIGGVGSESCASQLPKVLGASASGFDERDAPMKLHTRDLENQNSGAKLGDLIK